MTRAKGRISSDREKRQWLKTVLRWRCSVLPAILPRVIFLGLFGGLVTVLSNLNLPVALPALSSID